jgi:deazaflavin-dependent oxidoreductase (nitroreductase family)
MPVLQLTTIGRRTGQVRTVILTSPTRLGEALVVVAPRGGDDQHPGWFLNLQDESDVQVAVQGQPAGPMRARVAADAEPGPDAPALGDDVAGQVVGVHLAAANSATPRRPSATSRSWSVPSNSPATVSTAATTR